MKSFIIISCHVLFIAFCVIILCAAIAMQYWQGVGSMVFSLVVSGFSLVRYLVHLCEL